MKLKILLFLSPVYLGMALPLFIGCDRLAPLMPPPPPTPTPQVVWANGFIGTWFGNAMTAQCGACNTTGAVTAVNDPISGDTSALLLTANVPGGFYYFQSPVTVNPSNYYPTGHLQFDILLGQPAANITSMSLQYYNNGFSGNCGEYDFPATLISSWSSSSFTHVSTPFTAFTVTTGGCSGYAQNSIDTPFELSWSVSSSGTTITLDNIRWTFN